MADDPFATLPTELLLKIVKSLSCLVQLYSVTKTSRVMAALLDDFGREIIETVISQHYPDDTQRIIISIANIRSSGSAPTASVSEFIEQHTLRGETEYMVYIPPYVSHGLLQTAYEIERLAQNCIHEMLKACMARRPMVSSLPTKEENQRVICAFWHVQLLNDLNWVRSDWSLYDVRLPERTPAERLYCRDAPEEIRSVVEFIENLKMRNQNATTSEFQLPTAPTVPEFDWKQQTQPAKEGFPPVPRRPGNEGGERSAGLDVGRGPSIFWLIQTVSGHSPLRFATFDPFRRLGIAFWTTERLVDLGLWVRPPMEGRINLVPMFYAWQSIIREKDMTHSERLEDEEKEEKVREIEWSLANWLIMMNLKAQSVRKAGLGGFGH